MKKFHYFLAGAHFTLLTDHQAIEKGLKADADDELFRWARKLDCYSCTIIHKSGTSIPHADALSRRPTESAVRRLRRAEEFEIETMRDPVLNYIIQRLRSGTGASRPEETEYVEELSYYDRLLANDEIFLDNGRLMVRVDDSVRVVVPKGMRFQIFALAHSHPMAGHLGFDRTWSRIKDTYLWFKSASEIQQLVSACLVCAENNTRRTGLRASRKTVPVEGIPLSQWAMDVLGPLPESREGNLYILVVTDLFTKWVELFAMPDQKAQTVVECLTEVIQRYSIPASILSDNGSNFKSYLVKRMFETLQIKPVYTTVYHPQTDGQCERFNSTLIQTLRKLIQNEPREWDKKLQFVAFSYRTSKHSVTGYSPYQLVFGRKPRQPVHTLLEPRLTDTPKTFLNQFKEVDGWRRIALERINAEKESRVFISEGPEYREGDLVMLKNHSRTSKLSKVYKGPFRVCEVDDPNYVIEIDGKTKKIHAEQLKLFMRGGDDNRLELCSQGSGSEWSSVDEAELEDQDGAQAENVASGGVAESLVQMDNDVQCSSFGREIRKPSRYT